MSLAEDRNRVAGLCNTYLRRSIGQSTQSGAEAGLAGHAAIADLIGGGGDYKAILASARDGNDRRGNIDYWTGRGEAEAAKQGSEPIRCDGSASLIAYLLDSVGGSQYPFSIVSQGDPTHHGHWFVVVNNPAGYTPRFPNTFDNDSYVVDIWGAITSRRRSAVVYPAQCLYTIEGDDYEDNGIAVVCRGQGGYVAAAAPAGRRRGKRCYLTTATCQTMGLPDHCEALNTLRGFRDDILMQTPQGCRDVDQYYQVAPRIVEAIDQHPDAASIYQAIYHQTVRPSVEAIKRGQHQSAYEIYRAGLFDLQDGLLNEPC